MIIQARVSPLVHWLSVQLSGGAALKSCISAFEYIPSPAPAAETTYCHSQRPIAMPHPIVIPIPDYHPHT